MGTGNTLSTEILNYIFTATAPSWAANGNCYVALHSADPGAGGSQNTTEVAYTTYARVAVVRTASGWTVASQQSANTALITFPLCTAGSDTANYFSVGRDSTGAGEIWFSAQLTSPLAISVNITPQFAIGALTVTES